MKILRSTIYPPPGEGQPITAVASENDLRNGVAEVINETMATLDPPAFVVHEVFVVPDGTSLETCTLEAHRRQEANAERETNQAIAYYWYAGALLRCNTRGVVSATERAPLNVDELAEVARALARHPAYEHQTLLQIAEDGRIVRLTDGDVTIEEGP
jgi:hypothetical protein